MAARASSSSASARRPELTASRRSLRCPSASEVSSGGSTSCSGWRRRSSTTQATIPPMRARMSRAYKMPARGSRNAGAGCGGRVRLGLAVGWRWVGSGCGGSG